MVDRSGDPPSRTMLAAVEASTPHRVSATDWATSAHLRSLVDNSTTCIYVKDRAGRYLLINRQYELTFHVSNADFVGRTDDDLFPPDIARVLRQNDLEVMRRNEPVEFEEVVPHDDGPHTYISIKFPLHDAHGTAEAVCGISTDISERQRADAQLRRLTQQLVTIREEERQRLSFRIHDEICQELTGITFMLAAAARRLGPETTAGTRDLERASTQLARVIDHLRLVARSLHPVILRDLGLTESLRVLAQTLSTPQLRIEVDVPATLPAISGDLALGIYRIAQEATMNAVRHAETPVVRVAVDADPARIRLVVVDEGRGFETRGTVSRGLGLISMEQRATAAGGALAVDSAPGRGTRVTFICPLMPNDPGLP